MSFPLPDTWQWISLGDVHIGEKKSINPADYPDEVFEYYSIPAYQVGSVPICESGRNINSTKLLLEPGTILFGKLNPRVEKVWKVESHTAHRKIGSTEWLPIVPQSGVDPDFIYFLQWSEYVMTIAKQRVSGSTPSRQRVDPSSFYEIRVPLPPLGEQQKIAVLLATLQRVVKQQERLIVLLTELKKALMHKLFTEGTRGERQKQAEIGLVPESWELARLGDIAESFQYGTSVKCNYAINGEPVLRIPNIFSGHVDISDLKFGILKSNEVELLKLKYGDLLFVRTNGVKENAGRCSMYRKELNEDCYFASYLIRVRTPRDKLLPEFVDEYSRTSTGASLLSGRSIRTADGKFNINSGTLKEMLVPMPEPDEQSEITETAFLINQKLFNHVEKRQQLIDLFRTLLHQLMTAQIRVNDLDLTELEYEPITARKEEAI